MKRRKTSTTNHRIIELAMRLPITLENTHYVYVVQCGDLPYYKVGVYKDGSKTDRVRTMQTGNPFPLKRILKTVMMTKKKAEAFEKHIHYRFREYRVKGGGTEWFQFEERTLKKILKFIRIIAIRLS